jgi:hypothetical protein
MISGLVLKYLNGERFVIWRGYETTLLASTEFNLTVPNTGIRGILTIRMGTLLQLH